MSYLHRPSSCAMPQSIHELKICPYNPYHRVGVTTFGTHLKKCREQHPELAQKMDICLYNRSHHVLKEDMAYHLMMCPSFLEYQMARDPWKTLPVEVKKKVTELEKLAEEEEETQEADKKKEVKVKYVDMS